MTLVELLVAMSISTVLLIVMTAAATFIHRYITSWQNRSKLTEELSFGVQAISSRIESAQWVRPIAQRLDCGLTNGKRVSIQQENGRLLVDDRPLTVETIHVSNLAVVRLPLLAEPADSILGTRGRNVSGIYQVTLIGSLNPAVVETLVTTVRCNYEYFKYAR